MVATAITSQCRRVEPGTPMCYRSLRIVPLVGTSGSTPQFDVLGPEVLEKVTIAEVGDDGSVPVIRICNGLENRLLLLDGQELLGCKQNRILNADVLVPATREIDLPVSCVEQGRWGSRSKAFMMGKSAHRSARASKMSSVHRSLKSCGDHRSDQGEVWGEVADLLAYSGSQSSTHAMAAAYEQRRDDLDEIRASFTLPDNAIGYAVFDGDRFLGLDLFDRTTTVSGSWQAMIDGYVLDWVVYHGNEEAREAHTATEPVLPIEALLSRIPDEAWETFEAAGEGKDLRFDSDDLVGSALVCEDAVLHLQVFPKSARATRMPARSQWASPPRRDPVVPQHDGPVAEVRCPRCGFVYGTVRIDDAFGCNHCGNRFQD